MFEFTAIDGKPLKEIELQFKPSACCLGSLPTRSFKVILVIEHSPFCNVYE